MSDTGPSPTSVPLALDDLCEKATALLHAEQAGAAEQVYRAILSVEPRHPAANFNLGMLCMQLQHHQDGLSFLLAALEANPETAEYWLAYIEALLLDGQTDAAQQALALGQRHGLEGKAFENLASRLTDRIPLAAPPESAASAAPKKTVLTKAWRKGGAPRAKDQATLVAFFNQGRYREGAELARAMTERFPEHGFAWKVLGANLQKLGQDALPALQKAAELMPGDAQAHCNVGIALQELGQPEEALENYQQALKIDPGYVDAHYNQGVILQGLWQLEGAVACYRSALAIRPDFVKAYCNLGTTLRDLGRSAEAEAYSRRALAIDPDCIEALSNLGVFLEESGQLDSALACYRQALKIEPEHATAYSNLLCCLSLSETVDAQSLFAGHGRFAEQFEAPWRANWPRHSNARDPGRCLQIGFVSGDLRNHPIANFIEPVLAHLTDFPQLSLHAYSTHACVDEVTLRLSKHFAHWHPIFGVSDQALAQKIRADGIDILIDLSGHTGFNRLPCFARKPAPLQLSWMGFPGTTGLAAVDYYLADRFFLPPGQFDTQFTEKIVRLPANAPFLPSKEAPLVNALPARANGFVTFGSFNRINKLSRTVVALWAQLLRSLPDSRLLVGGMPVDGNHDTLIEWFAQEDIDRQRLDFHVRSTMTAYLEMHHQVDICLDTFPYNGGTTTFHALWMGVPTLNLAGATAAGRTGSAILGNVGLDAFVASSKTDFVEKGRYWAEHIDELSSIRAGLRERFEQSAAGQPKLIARAFEHALRVMWKRWCAGLPAESFEVSRADVADRPQEVSGKSESLDNAPIFVTQPCLPPLEEFIPYLEKIWESKWLTNSGQFHQQLEQALCDYLGVKHLALFANGTLALVTALQALRIKGEVITTPYSFVATSHSLMWNGIKPVFVDIDPQTLNLDPAKIEAAITPKTTAILAVHCYGHPCNVDAIQKIADNYNLKVIYDAAHAFGVQDGQGSVLRHGDLSVLSFHATKVFNTFEGGAIICPDAKTKQHVDHLKNFGFVDEVTVVATGINGKMSEINAAFGLLQLKGIDEALRQRKAIDALYREGLAGVDGVFCLPVAGEIAVNYAYFPILVRPGYPLSRDGLFEKLKDNNIFARRYFFPLISDFSMYRGMPSAAHANLPVARKVAEEVICLPIYPALDLDVVRKIVALIAIVE